MLNKTSHLLTGILVFSSLTVAGVGSAMADTIDLNNAQTSDFTISQLRGHQTYKGLPQMKMSDYIIGTVVGQAGGIVTILLPDGTSFNTTMTDSLNPGVYNYYGGMDVRVQEVDGAYVLVGLARPTWITKLEGYKEVEEVDNKTSSVLDEVGDTPLVGLPPMQEETKPMVMEEVQPEAVRGMW